MHFEFSPEALKTRGGPIDQFLEMAFDGAIILDAQANIVFNTRKSAQLVGKSQAEAVGHHVSFLDGTTPFAAVLASGRPEIGILVVVNGRKCMSDLYPVFWEGRVVGVIGVLLFRSMNRLKKIIASLNDGGSPDIYNAVARIDANYTFDDFIGETPAVRTLIALCRKVAQRQIRTILILGETGTGKEILASGFHAEHATLRPFVKINCTAIPNDLLESELFGHEKGAFTGATTTKQGKFELASGGTILLDEIGEMDLRLQGKLLRVLEEGEFERIGGTQVLPLQARIIASTNQELKERCRNGKFRPDLYYRLCGAEIRIPPLRARAEDIPLLVRHLCARANLELAFSPDAMAVLTAYPWPGNVRELRNVLRWLSLQEADGAISAEAVRRVLADPTAPPTGSNMATSLGGVERQMLVEALERSRFNVSAAARRLGVSRGTLRSRIRKHGIAPRDSPSP